LVQVRGGGQALIPIRFDGYTTFFGEPTNIHCEGNLLRAYFSPSHQGMFKIGLRASAMFNIMAYLEIKEDGHSYLLMRVAEKAQDMDYADTPWHDPTDRGYAAQLFYGGAEHGFGELEWHAPCLGAPTRLYRRSIKSTLYGLSGPRGFIEACARDILKYDLSIGALK
jgi:hypothetical protein